MSNQITRAIALETFKETFHGSKLWKRLRYESQLEVITFIYDHRNDPSDLFETQLNRMHLWRDDKPKQFAMIQEVLSCSNTLWNQLNRKEAV